LILRFGKVIETLSNPGLQWKPGLLIPGTTRLSVSHALEGLRIEDVHVNDRDGTTMRMDFWLECRIVDAKAALFAVEDWRDSLRGVLKHSLMSGGGTRRFENIISERDSLVQEVLSETSEHARRWGIQIEALS